MRRRRRSASPRTSGLRLGAGDSFYYEQYLEDPEADSLLRLVDSQVCSLPRDNVQLACKICGRQHNPPCDKATYGAVQYLPNGLVVGPYYKYSSDTPHMQDWSGTALAHVARRLDDFCDQVCNHVEVNQDQTGRDYIGPHHDKFKSRPVDTRTAPTEPARRD